MTEELSLIADIWNSLGIPNEKVIQLLKKSEFGIQDLLEFKKLTQDQDEDLAEMLSEIEIEILHRIPVEQFINEIDRLLETPLFKFVTPKGSVKKKSLSKAVKKRKSHKRDILIQIKKFLSNETQETYDGNHTANLILIIPEMNNETDQQICLMLLQKINTLLDIDNLESEVTSSGSEDSSDTGSIEEL